MAQQAETFVNLLDRYRTRVRLCKSALKSLKSMAPGSDLRTKLQRREERGKAYLVRCADKIGKPAVPVAQSIVIGLVVGSSAGNMDQKQKMEISQYALAACNEVLDGIPQEQKQNPVQQNPVPEAKRTELFAIASHHSKCSSIGLDLFSDAFDVGFCAGLLAEHLKCTDIRDLLNYWTHHHMPSQGAQRK